MQHETTSGDARGRTTTPLGAAVVLVAGGTGRVGTSIARALLRAGACVVVPSRAAERLARLRAAVADVAADRLIGVVADLGTPAGADELRARTLGACGRVDAVAAALGGWPPRAGYGAAPFDPARPVLDESLTAHFVTAGALFAPLAAHDRASYTMVIADGAAAEIGLRMLARLFMHEAEATPVRVNAVVVGPLRNPLDAPARAVGGSRGPTALAPADVGTFVTALADARADARAELFHLSDRTAFRGALARVRGQGPHPRRTHGAAAVGAPVHLMTSLDHARSE